MSATKSWIAAPAGLRLTADEKAFFADERPWGYILFARNVGDGTELCDLTAELKELGGRPTTPIFIDQEGGRVQRLRPPLAPSYPAAAAIGRIYERDPEAGRRAAWLHGRLLAADLARFGINADCIPCIDTPVEGANSVISDRAYSVSPDVVSTLGGAAAEGLMAGGLLPVMKHIPGHGRGNADSHLELPVVRTPLAELERTDFVPFQALRALPAAMTAHILYSEIDPQRPGTLSPIVVETIIRGRIGFDGLLMTDDMSMKALAGDFTDLGRAALDAGCDMLLHCNGDMTEMRGIAAAARALTSKTQARAERAEAVIASAADRTDVSEFRAEYDDRLAKAA